MQNETICLIKVLKLAGALILENGGDTHRAEDTAERICAAAGYPDSDVLALPTGIMITLSGADDDNGLPVSVVRRIKRRTINLSKLERVNSIARMYTDGKISLEEAFVRLNETNTATAFKGSLFINSIYAGLSSGLFALLLGGGWFEFLISFICGVTVQLISALFQNSSIYNFAISLIGGILIACIAVAAIGLTGMGNLDLIIIGSIMTLLPGLAMTNAIRDAMTGDLVSGAARLADVLLVALALAGGVGIVLSLYINIGGALH